MAVLQNIPQLSIWDLSHYWHGENPKLTHASSLPLKVQQTIRAFALKVRKGLYLRCESGGFIFNVLNEEPIAVSRIARIYQRELKTAYSGKKFKKSFLSGISMGRQGVLIWCKETNCEPPKFWFDEDDPILKKSIHELVSPLSEEQMRKYGYFPLFMREPEAVDFSQSFKISNTDSLTTESPELLEKNSAIKKAISEISARNAKFRYEPSDKIKAEFKQFFTSNSYQNKRQAARDYFNGLTLEYKKIVVPSYYEKDHENCLEKAIRNLTKVLPSKK